MTPTTLIYEHADFGHHEVPPGHVEHSGRYGAVTTRLADGEFSTAERITPSPSGFDAVRLAHPDAQIDHIRTAAPEQGLSQLDADTFMGPSSLAATLHAVGAVTDAVDRLFAQTARNAFIVARPPGHHAEAERAMGFCLFNHAAIAALYAQASHHAERVAVVDFDVHHGNGTEAIFWHRENTFFASSHEWPQYPGTGRETDQGAHGNIVNAPLATGTGGTEFRRAWGERLLPALEAFCPDLIVISAGFDAHRADPLGGLGLDEDDFAWVTAQIAAVADTSCMGRIVSVLEGGYDLTALAESAAAHVRALIAA